MMTRFRAALVAALLFTLPLATAAPASAQQTVASPAGFSPIQTPCLGAVGEACVPLAQGATTAPLNVSTAATTQLVALSAGKVTYVTHLNVVAGGTGNITFVTGTGVNCGTGQSALSGAYNLTAQAGLSAGGGLGAVMIVPAGQALCVTTSAAVQMSGFVTFVQR